ncbi:MAG: tail fiber protein [Chloroflexota bacterium]
MSDQFIGEIRPFAGNFAPSGWFLCDGSSYSVSKYTALFSIIGVIYGGDGRTTFAVPDLSQRAPLHPDGPYKLNSHGGDYTVTLSEKTMPKHTHTLQGATSRAGSLQNPANAAYDNSNDAAMYASATAVSQTMSEETVAEVGVGNAHNNMSPYLALNFIIAYDGVFPPRE